jgi:AraC family transcriptional regulator
MKKGIGSYFGRVENSAQCDGALLSEVSHSCPRCLPRHAHENAFFSTLISGSYFEEIEGRKFEYRPFETGFHPSQMPHHDVIGRKGARFLCIEITPEAKADLSSNFASTPILLSEELAIPMARAYSAIIHRTFSPLCLEGILWELVGAVSRFDKRSDRRIPNWLQRCVDFIRANYPRALTIQDMALCVGIHPVHLSREFRRLFGQTVGEYAHQVRIRSACSLLVSSGGTVAQVAMDCGFSDHSHFCRVFKRLIGRSPSEFRRAHVSHRALAFESDALLSA